ncbi:unnamed protein product [Meganyctiphanes norvegica]|uniref:Xylose isomerase n=1 Tax=Meganyctiphanes norvegica TaxID=48144 RepID=A0AAV2PJ45_MEGNR
MALITTRFFPSVTRIEYLPDAGPEDNMVFRHYNPTEIVHGRTMEEWLRFSPCYFNMFRYFGTDDHYGYRTHIRPWDEGYSWTARHNGRTNYDMGGKYMDKSTYDMAGNYMDKSTYDVGTRSKSPHRAYADVGKGRISPPIPLSYGGYDDRKGRSWENGSRSLSNYKRRMQAAFEFFNKLGVRYYSASDRDFAPEGETWEETNRMLEETTTMACNLQQQSGMRPLYFAADLFSHPRYMNGAATNPNFHVFAYACAQVKRAMDMAKRLQAENFVFFHPRDGYQNPLQRQIYRDIQHLGHLYRMAAQYKDNIGYKGHLLIQPKPFGSLRHQYESDAMSTMQLLRHFGMERSYKLYVKPAWSRMMGRPYHHDVYMASAFSMLGLVDAADSYPEANGSSDICSANVHDATIVMKCYMEQKTGSYKSGRGYGYGGFTLSCRVRRESFEPRDMFHGMILTMDTYACALKNSARMLSDGCFARNLQQRYISYKSGFGEKLDKGSTSFEECEEYIRSHGDVQVHSSRHEHHEQMFNYYVYPSVKYSAGYSGHLLGSS